MNIKEQYRRFRQWQVTPMKYEDKRHEPCHCANCGHEVTTEYCPVCGQKSDVGRITWHSVRRGVMLLWGMDSRSMPYSLWQLLWRPGYYIHDYLSGRRQVSFPPVKMLFIVAVFAMVADHLIGDSAPEVTAAVSSTPTTLENIGNFLENNLGWGMLLTTSLFILPTWVLFRFSPRHDHHTLPEGFFIQVFMSTLILLLNFISVLAGLFSSSAEMLITMFIFVYYIIVYHQLFGYGWWGTIWRLLCCLFSILFTLLFLVFVWKAFISSEPSRLKSHGKISCISIGIILALCALMLGGGYLIGKRRETSPQPPSKESENEEGK